MPAFHFRLASVLRLREQTRDERRQQLAEAYRLEQSLQGRWQALEETAEQLKDQYRSASRPGPTDVDRLIETSRFEAVLRGEQHVLQQQIRAVAEEVERRREALVAADRDVRTLEKLRDSQHTRFVADEERHELRRLDEVATMRASREVE